ncbi:MAG: mechanosensitive ion channel family protein [Campylobacterota bacterium]|nr:mechanosensitive ion channel family protein [Campylobacterota bacterium]
MLNGFMQQTFLQNRILDYLIFIAVFLVSVFVIQIFKVIILKRLKKWAEKTNITIDDFLIHIIEKTLLPLLYFGAFYLSTRCLTLSSFLNKAIDALGITLLTAFGIYFLIKIINYALENYWLKKGKDATKERNIKAIMPIAKIIIWGLGIIFLLNNLGFKISAVIAGLGIGGVAVALAAQAILGDLFSYFAILFDRPFEIGDFIILDNYLGTIEHIGIKTTRIRSLGGEQLVLSNTDLTSSRLRNYKRMGKRRVIFRLGVTYETSLEQLKEIPTTIRDIVKSIDDTIFDRAHFFSYGDFSLIFEIVYYIVGRDYKKYMNIQQEINFKLKEEFEKRAIEFAYPTQTLYLNKTDKTE